MGDNFPNNTYTTIDLFIFFLYVTQVLLAADVKMDLDMQEINWGKHL